MLSTTTRQKNQLDESYNYVPTFGIGSGEDPQQQQQQQDDNNLDNLALKFRDFLQENRNRFGTRQADQALRTNTGFTRDNTRDQLDFEERSRRNRAMFDTGLARDQQRFNADMGNAASNANTARQMALNSQNTLNSVYADAGNRLNNAARNTNDSIIAAGQIVTGMFR